MLRSFFVPALSCIKIVLTFFFFSFFVARYVASSMFLFIGQRAREAEVERKLEEQRRAAGGAPRYAAPIGMSALAGGGAGPASNTTGRMTFSQRMALGGGGGGGSGMSASVSTAPAPAAAAPVAVAAPAPSAHHAQDDEAGGVWRRAGAPPPQQQQQSSGGGSAGGPPRRFFNSKLKKEGGEQ